MGRRIWIQPTKPGRKCVLKLQAHHRFQHEVAQARDPASRGSERREDFEAEDFEAEDFEAEDSEPNDLARAACLLLGCMS